MKKKILFIINNLNCGGAEKALISLLENGIIVEMNSTAIFNGIKRIIDDENLRGKLTNNLSEENLGTESEIEKIYELIESY